MVVSVRLSSGLAQVTGNARVSILLEQGATVAQLLDRLCAEYPSLSEKLASTVTVINGKTVDRSEPLSVGQEVVVLSPVSGG